MGITNISTTIAIRSGANVVSPSPCGWAGVLPVAEEAAVVFAGAAPTDGAAAAPSAGLAPICANVKDMNSGLGVLIR
jgi:hypothetical protein